MERKDELKRRVEDAARFVDLDRLAVSPQCGFASIDTGNPISPEVQEDKVEAGGRARPRHLGRGVNNRTGDDT